MRLSDFDYDLPAELIAQHPLEPRSSSRLLALGVGTQLQDLHFNDLTQLLRPGDVLVFNDTRVIPARMRGHKDSGGAVEVLVERVLDTRRVLAQIRASKTPKPGQCLQLEQSLQAEVIGRRGEFFELAFIAEEDVLDLLQRYGHMPLPPYITRADEAEDRERYQTVYARHPGAVAAPTAGLHFDQDLLQRLVDIGVKQTFITLHVGAGTFQPLRVDDIEQHRMHSECVHIDAASCQQIERAKAAGGRVIAVGTTVVRALESATDAHGALRPFTGETDIFIRPGYRFRQIDAMITNFHLPQSTLLMLVCAFGGTEPVLAAYRHAVANKYRFYSYGDAMFILPQMQDTRDKEQE